MSVVAASIKTKFSVRTFGIQLFSLLLSVGFLSLLPGFASLKPEVASLFEVAVRYFYLPRFALFAVSHVWLIVGGFFVVFHIVPVSYALFAAEERKSLGDDDFFVLAFVEISLAVTILMVTVCTLVCSTHCMA